MVNAFFVCPLDRLPRAGARGFTVQGPRGPVDLILLCWRGEVRAYENRCPHTGVNLEWRPDVFMDPSGRYLQCATHGALFDPGDGRCVAGPCAGEGLRAWPVQLRDDGVWLLAAE